MAGKLKSLSDQYLSTDLFAKADVRADLTDAPWPNGSWDAIVCSHVMEHIPDDVAAMREIARMLSSDGHAIIVVPWRPTGFTDEYPSILDPVERTRRFGQFDHVRVYGADVAHRLRQAGFTSIEEVGLDRFTQDEIERHRLDVRKEPDTPLADITDGFFLCRVGR